MASHPAIHRARAESVHLRRHWQRHKCVPPPDSFSTLRGLLNTAKVVYRQSGRARAHFDWHGALLAVRCSSFGQLSVLDLATGKVLVTSGAGAY